MHYLIAYKCTACYTVCRKIIHPTPHLVGVITEVGGLGRTHIINAYIDPLSILGLNCMLYHYNILPVSD